MIKDFEPRLYQQTIFATCASKNTLVVLPTGMGKTNIFLMLASHRLKQYPNSKILFIGPTRPLIDQYREVFKKHFEIDESKLVIFTGMVNPEKRAELWKDAKIIFSTPQGLENDIISKRISLEEVSLLGFDEAHKAVKDYSYVWIAKQYNKLARYPRIVALTASPGSDIEHISEVCTNLFIEDIEVRTEKDPDVKPYVQEMELEWIEVEIPESFVHIKNYFNECMKSKIKEIKNLGYITQIDGTTSKKDLLALQGSIHSEIAHGNKDYAILKTISLIAEIMKVQHGLELLESQGITSLHIYLNKLKQESFTTKVKAVKNLANDINFKSALIKTDSLFEKKIEHPKLEKLKSIVKDEIEKNKDMKMIVFNQYRDNALMIVNELNKMEKVKSRLFVGQMKKGDTGLTQKKQKEILDQFRNNEFNVLVSTSIGEEGLDIPKVNTVVFYEPIPSAIRTIQRKGRTARHGQGRVIILVAKNTRDVSYRWSAFHKENRMYRTLESLKRKISSPLMNKKEETLNKFIPEEDKVKIYADFREKGSGVIKELIEIGVDIKLEMLKIGDYVCSEKVAVEIKTVKDFVDSIVDNRLLQQLKEIKRNFERPIVIVDGTEDIYSMRRVHPNAIRGMIATIAVSYGIPIIYSKGYKETASYLHIIAKREQEDGKRDFNLHGERKPLTLKEQQEYVVSSLPGVGPALARPLLKKFKTVKKVINAKPEQLEKVEKIGPKKAAEIKKVTESEYE
ncbi:MAG: DEAD/DEAH box helicase [Candidatus Nanoarchaeia archaeon]|nr:DEAD/DEAH box helicase [Candidatus Nanoarchaeia archaeon]